MKAVVYHRYGSPDELRIEEIDKPVPTDDQLLIKVHAVSINGTDKENLIGKPLYTRMAGARRPRHPILGSDISGRVEAVGKNITEFEPGADVFGELPGYHGGFAEYVCTSGATLLPKPSSLTFEEAAAIPQGGVIAFNSIRKQGQVQPGQQVLINGAGGSAGSFAIQLATADGAVVTGVDSAEKLAFMQSLGAAHVIDYARQDFTRGDATYDLILDVAAQRPVSAYQRALKPGGTCFLVGGSVARLLQALLLGSLDRGSDKKRVRVLGVPQNREDLAAIAELCEVGDVAPIIDRRYALSDVPEALHYVVGGHTKGKVVITV